MKTLAYAKINACLDVVERRKDGYHTLNMIMLPISLADEIEIQCSQNDEYSSNIDMMFNEKNTIVKAVELMRKTYQLNTGFKIHVNKKIPMEAGLAGGSSDAAAVMKAINQLCKCNQSDESLAALGKQIGADVPFCVIAKPSIVGGIGELITPFELTQHPYILLVKPKQGVSTGKAFSMLDFDTIQHCDVEKVKWHLIDKDYTSLQQAAFNSLEAPAFTLVPRIKEIKEMLMDKGFEFALMSGSGSTVFALTENKELIQQAINENWFHDEFVCSCEII